MRNQRAFIILTNLVHLEMILHHAGEVLWAFTDDFGEMKPIKQEFLKRVQDSIDSIYRESNRWIIEGQS